MTRFKSWKHKINPVITRASSNTATRYALQILSVAIVYFIAARAGLLLAFHHTNATPVWPPSGIAFAAILLLGYSVWPGIFIGALAVNVYVFLSSHTCGINTAIWVSSVIAIGNTIEALMGYYLLKKVTDENGLLQNAAFAFRFSLIAAGMCLVSSAIGPAAVSIAEIEAWEHYPVVWFTWWLGDVSGVLIFTPLILAWARTHNKKWIRNRKAEAIILFLTLILLSDFLFSGGIFIKDPFVKPYLIIPLLLWFALRFEVREVVTVIALTSGIAVWGTVNGLGPFVSNTLHESLLSLQCYIAIMSVTFLILSTSIAERKAAQKKLQDAHNELELRVRKRTVELKMINESLKHKSSELIMSNHELEHFAYAASHDLQEPLRIITSYVQLLEKTYKGKLDKDADAFIHFTVDATKRMHTLIDDLLSYSRVGFLGKEFQKCDGNTIMKRVLENLKSSIAETKAIIHFDRLPHIHADESQMIQLFQNIIGNAVKFRGEKIPEIRITVKDDVSRWLFSVSDNGIGIQKEYRDQIFVIFQRLHPVEEYPGSGIGLAICKKIIERHRGEIGVESEVGKGTTFYFTIPKEFGFAQTQAHLTASKGFRTFEAIPDNPKKQQWL